MRCAWDSFLRLLPLRLRAEVDRLGKETLQEFRVRVGQSPQLILRGSIQTLDGIISADDLSYIVNAASRYSPWSAASTAQGYLTVQGGHRIGICGEAILNGHVMTGFRHIRSLCIRIARDFPGIARTMEAGRKSVLIIGRPGSGKTTLLRDLIRHRSDHGQGSVAVIDEREEIFPYVDGICCFSQGSQTDVLTGCPKPQGIEMVLRTMGPSCIAVDEITALDDCNALLHAGWCGVTLIATAHAANRNDLLSRGVYRPIVESKLFDKLLVLQPDMSWQEERMNV